MFDFLKGRNIEKGVQKTRDSWFRRLTRLLEGGETNGALWDEVEEILISADVGVATTTKLLNGAKERMKKERRQTLKEALKEEMVSLLTLPAREGAEPTSSHLPLVLLVIGVNGVGKTTSIAKLAHSFREQGRGVLIAAADTFRAAAIDQLRLWGERVEAPVIAHQPGADPGAVVFDAYQAARNRDMEVLIIDTAGRLHTKYNLMEELKKIKRVIGKLDSSAPHQVLLVLDATTGQNGLSQARHFTQAVGVDGIFLAKLDGTAKGGILLTICQELGIPILYVGTGEKLEDMALFDAQSFVEALFS
ncbi:MAG: signal recognition particle-docking protein FtsY [Chloroflexi bacterium]|nr:signal recognition particle-docking protein FtsY [Chloroflexota bacterium]